MSADPVPVPPPADQGFPPRPSPYMAVPGNMQFARMKLQPGQSVPGITLIYDSPDARVVSFWTEESFILLAKRMLAFTGTPQLTLADERDLNALRDARPFEGGGKA